MDFILSQRWAKSVTSRATCGDIIIENNEKNARVFSYKHFIFVSFFTDSIERIEEKVNIITRNLQNSRVRVYIGAKRWIRSMRFCANFYRITIEARIISLPNIFGAQGYLKIAATFTDGFSSKFFLGIFRVFGMFRCQIKTSVNERRFEINRATKHLRSQVNYLRIITPSG